MNVREWPQQGSFIPSYDHETFYVPEEEFPNKNEDGDELLHDDEWALKDEEAPVHINKPPSDINNTSDQRSESLSLNLD